MKIEKVKVGKVKVGKAKVGRAKVGKIAVVGRYMQVCIESEVPQGSSWDLESPVLTLGYMDLTQRGTEV